MLDLRLELGVRSDVEHCGAVRDGFSDGRGDASASKRLMVLGPSSAPLAGVQLADAPNVPSGLTVLALLRCVRGGPNDVPTLGRAGFGTVSELPSPVPSN